MKFCMTGHLVWTWMGNSYDDTANVTIRGAGYHRYFFTCPTPAKWYITGEPDCYPAWPHCKPSVVSLMASDVESVSVSWCHHENGTSHHVFNHHQGYTCVRYMYFALRKEGYYAISTFDKLRSRFDHQLYDCATKRKRCFHFVIIAIDTVYNAFFPQANSYTF